MKYICFPVLICLYVLFIVSSVTFAEGQKYKFGQGFKLEKPAEIYSEKLLNVKNFEANDNSTTSTIDPIKNTLILSNLRNETSNTTTNDNDEEIGFKKLEEGTDGTNPMFPDREFRGSHRPDFCNSALGLTFGD